MGSCDSWRSASSAADRTRDCRRSGRTPPLRCARDELPCVRLPCNPSLVDGPQPTLPSPLSLERCNYGLR
jgi:hypothetical protein